MDKYVAMRPKSYISEHGVPEQLPTITVYETASEPIDTGLLDSSGTRLYLVNDRDPIGFVIRSRK